MEEVRPLIDLELSKCPPRVPPHASGKGKSMAAVMIGVDRHKGSHTAVVIDQAEDGAGPGEGAGLRGTGEAGQVSEAAGLAGADLRAIEGACGLGHRRGPGAAPPRVSGCWMCSPSWPCGCSGRRQRER